MNRPIERIYDESGNYIDREMNDEEFSQYEQDRIAIEASLALEAEAELKRTEAKAKLETLGLTVEDLKALGL